MPSAEPISSGGVKVLIPLPDSVPVVSRLPLIQILTVLEPSKVTAIRFHWLTYGDWPRSKLLVTDDEPHGPHGHTVSTMCLLCDSSSQLLPPPPLPPPARAPAMRPSPSVPALYQNSMLKAPSAGTVPQLSERLLPELARSKYRPSPQRPLDHATEESIEQLRPLPLAS